MPSPTMSSDTQRANSGNKKKGGGFLSRQAKAKSQPEPKDPISEEELLKKDTITPEDVLRLNKTTERKCTYFCWPATEADVDFAISSAYCLHGWCVGLK